MILVKYLYIEKGEKLLRVGIDKDVENVLLEIHLIPVLLVIHTKEFVSVSEFCSQ
jgi:hypothetical protein